MTEAAQEERTPAAYLIKADGGSWLQFTPDVADADKALVTIEPLYTDPTGVKR